MRKSGHFNTVVYFNAFMTFDFPGGRMRWKWKGEVLTFASGMLTVFNKQSRNISEFVVPLHCFLIE